MAGEEKAQNHPKSSKIIQHHPTSSNITHVLLNKTSVKDRHLPDPHGRHLTKKLTRGMRCHDFQAGGPETTLEAGQSFDATWTMEAGHPGDCYFYLSSTAGIGLLWPVMACLC